MGYSYGNEQPIIDKYDPNSNEKDTGSFLDKLLRRKPSLNDLYSFFLHLSAFYDTGYSLPQAFEIMAAQPNNLRLKAALLDMRQSLQNGASLSDAFAAHQDIFPKYCCLVMKAGEQSGILNNLLVEIGVHIKQDGDVSDSIRSGLLLPKIVMCVLVFALFIILTQLIPKYQEVYREIRLELPLITQGIFAIYQFVSNNLIIFFTVAAIAFWSLIRLYRSNPDKVDVLLLRLPVYRDLYYMILQYRFTKSLGLFLKAGTGAADALRYTADVMDNAVARRVLNDAAEKCLIGGYNISDAINESNSRNIINYMPVNFIKNGEETGKVVDLLAKVSNFYENLIAIESKDFPVKISTVILIPTAAFEALILAAILLPSVSLIMGVV